MRNKNPGRISLSFYVPVLLVLLLITVACHQENKAQRATESQRPSDVIVFEGTLETLGPDPGFVSGVLASYRLAKYRVEKICEGQYDGTEIIVDHRIFTLKEFEGINVNDRLCITVKKSTDTSEQFYDNVLRSPTDDIKTRYIAQKEITRWNGPCCQSQR